MHSETTANSLVNFRLFVNFFPSITSSSYILQGFLTKPHLKTSYSIGSLIAGNKEMLVHNYARYPSRIVLVNFRLFVNFWRVKFPKKPLEIKDFGLRYLDQPW